MAQYAQFLVNTTQGSPTIIGTTGTRFLNNVKPGYAFKIKGDPVVYQIANVVSDTELILTVPFQGPTDYNLLYQITTDYTPNFNLAEVNVGDADWPIFLTKLTIRKIDEVLGVLSTGSVFIGTWNAETNTPPIPPAAPENQGHFYKVSTYGTTELDGVSEWFVGDTLMSNGSRWVRVPSPEWDFVELTQQAKESAKNSENSARESELSEINAEVSEENAYISELNAKDSEIAASNSARESELSEINAGVSESNAYQSELNAKGSEEAAASSERNSALSEINAGVSESNAYDSELSAKESETTSKTSEINAKTSETNAELSEINASISEGNTYHSELNAKTSETNAKTSETNAELSEINASISEENAYNSETNAKTSETNAELSEINAGISEENAYHSELNAKTSEENADATLRHFKTLWLGEFNTDPVKDNEGNNLKVGMLYYYIDPLEPLNNIVKIYNGTAWVAAYASLSGALIAVNNLEDVQNIDQARRNLQAITLSESISMAIALG